MTIKVKKMYNQYISSQTLIPCSKSTRRKLNVLKTVFNARNMNDTLNILIGKNEELRNVKKELDELRNKYAIQVIDVRQQLNE